MSQKFIAVTAATSGRCIIEDRLNAKPMKAMTTAYAIGSSNEFMSMAARRDDAQEQSSFMSDYLNREKDAQSREVLSGKTDYKPLLPTKPGQDRPMLTL